MKKGKDINIWLAMSMFLLLMVSTAAAQTIYVDDDATGANNGSNWTDAYRYLQDALANALSGDEIWVAEGIYKPDQGVGITPGDRTATFQLINGVTLKGGYAGASTPDPNARDIEKYETILSGDLNGDDEPNFINYDENSYHVVTGSDTDTTAVLDGFTITDANTDGPYPHSYGGGMYNYSGSPTLTNCILRDNSASSGAGMYNYKSSPTLTNCTFNGNSGSSGGGMYNHYICHPTLMNCTFSRNSAKHGGGMYNKFGSNPSLTSCTFMNNSGRGMLNNRSSPRLTNCLFWGNSSSEDGGGMVNVESSPTLNDCTFSGNSTEWHGGGMYNVRQSNPTLTNCTFTDNLAGRKGGGMYISSSSNPIVTECTFSENSASSDGGGIFNDSRNLTMNNCTLIGNSADYGGGMCNHYCRIAPSLLNCRFIGNSAHYEGGGVYNRSSNLILTNCTFSGNSAESGGGIYSSGENYSPTLKNCILWANWYDEIVGSAVVSYSDVQGSWPGECNIDADPCFVDPCGGDFHLLAESPCIDAGDPNYIPFLGETDIDGEPRVMAGRVDMGIDEFTSTLTPILRICPTEFQFQLYADIHNLESQILTIRNTGSGTLNWKVAEDCLWLQVYPANGVSIGEVNEVNLIVDISRLKPGPYDCELTITADGAVDSPQMVPLNLHVYDSGKLHVPSEYPTIQEAIDFAFDGAIIIIADGTHAGLGNRDIDFSGKAITVRSENGPANCFIDCQGSESEPHRAFIFQNGEDTNSIVTGLSIINGYAEHGGAIYCDHSSPTVSNCTFSGNSAFDGGGMYNSGSSPVLINCTFIGNSATNWAGGGMYNYGSSPVLSNCTFSNNWAESTGGGMYNWESSNPTLTNCTFSGNSAHYGAGMCNYYSNPILTNCIFSGNVSYKWGGAIYNSLYNGMYISNCTFTGNWAGEAGGGIYITPPPPETAGESTITSYYITNTITNCIFWDNLPEQIVNWNSPLPWVTYCDVQGGRSGVFEPHGAPSCWREGNIDADPCFVQPGYWADINDPNIVVEPNDPNAIWIDGDYHLKSQAGRWEPSSQSWVVDEVTSPCIDAGNPTDPIGQEPFPNGGIINMGAYGGTAEASKSYFGEPVCETIVAGDINGDCKVNFVDFAFMAFHWLEEK